MARQNWTPGERLERIESALWAIGNALGPSPVEIAIFRSSHLYGQIGHKVRVKLGRRRKGVPDWYGQEGRAYIDALYAEIARGEGD